MENIILDGVVGSRAYGLATDDSDTDTLGVFVAPTLDVSGLFWSSKDETVTNASPDGDDYTYHEVGKFLRLILKGNPTMIEFLFLDEHTSKDKYGDLLVSNAIQLIPLTDTYYSYLGYAQSQLEKFNHSGTFKYAKHALRLLEQGEDLLTTGSMSVKVKEPKNLLDLEDEPKLVIVREVEDKLVQFVSLRDEYLTNDKLHCAELAEDILHLIRKDFLI